MNVTIPSPKELQAANDKRVAELMKIEAPSIANCIVEALVTKMRDASYTKLQKKMHFGINVVRMCKDDDELVEIVFEKLVRPAMLNAGWGVSLDHLSSGIYVRPLEEQDQDQSKR